MECSKLTVIWKNGNGVISAQHDVIVKLFWRCFVSLVNFSYWSKFNANIIIGAGVITISFFKGLTINPEIVKNRVWALPSIWRLGWLRNNKFGKSVSNKMLLNAAKCQGDTFYIFWVIKAAIPTGGVKLSPILPPPSPLPSKQTHTQIRIKMNKVENKWSRITLKVLTHFINE